jgi:ABC-type lipoprotein release transport system permease subunit
LNLATLTSVTAVYLLIALVAAYVPARRALTLDAMRALKAD